MIKSTDWVMLKDNHLENRILKARKKNMFDCNENSPSSNCMKLSDRTGKGDWNKRYNAVEIRQKLNPRCRETSTRV